MQSPTLPHARSYFQRQIGRTLEGRYRLEAIIGTGEMSAVFRAQNLLSGRAVAIKLLHPPEGSETAGLIQRFLREPQAANRILLHGRRHPNVIDAIDVGQDPDTKDYYFVQELLHGQNLAAYLQGQPGRRIEIEEALEILRPVMDAIACAHEAGIVHRDLKPANVFLHVPGPDQPVVPKVLDFGVSQMRDARMTGVHDILGTVDYMAPEAFTDARHVNARSDVWSLAVMFYELVAGEAPFSDPKKRVLQTMRAIAVTHPPSLAANGRMPATTWAVLRRCLSKDAAQRYPDARALLEALDESVAPVRTLRIPPGADTVRLRQLLGLSEALRAAESSAVGMPGMNWSAPPPQDPARVWWRVVFDRTDHTPDAILEILGMRELQNLTELEITGIPLGAEGLEKIVMSRVVGNVARLALDGAGIGADGIAVLGRSPFLRDLLALSVGNDRADPEAVAQLGASQYLPGLGTLNLVALGLDDACAERLAACPLLPQLARLDLRANQIGDAGVLALSSSPQLGRDLTLILALNPCSPAASSAAAVAVQDRIAAFLR